MPTYKSLPLVGKWKLTKRELAAKLGCTERTVNTWMYKRYIPYHKLGNGRILFCLADVQAALARYEIKEVAP
jgi:excisionase family DNA binding protein